MENLVVTLETAQKLKMAGWPNFEDSTHFCWNTDITDKRTKLTSENCEVDDYRYLDFYKDVHGEYPHIVAAAPTAQEIADQIMQLRSTGKIAPYTLEMGSNGVGYQCTWGELRTLHFNTMAEALAALWLKLQEAK